jgi:adenylate cyclase
MPRRPQPPFALKNQELNPVRLNDTQLIITALILAGALLLRIADPTPVARLRLSVFDAYQNALPRAASPEAPVRILDIDEVSLKKIGQWPWPRTKLADIIDRLREAGAKAIALDLILAEPDRLSPATYASEIEDEPALKAVADQLRRLPSHDQRLAESIAKAPVVVGFAAEAQTKALLGPARAGFAIAGDDPVAFVPGFPGAVSSLEMLSEKAAGLGAVNWLPERDQIVRRVPLLVAVGGKLYPSLTLEALRLGKGETSIFVKSSGGSGASAYGEKTGVEAIRIADTILPTDGAGEMWIHFSETNPHLYLSAHKVLDGTFKRSEVEGRYIFIGSSAAGLLDLRANPIATAVPGVEIHAQALEQMLSGETLERPSYATGAEIVFLVLSGLGLAWLLRRSGPVWAAILGVLSVAAVSLYSWLAFANGKLLFDPVYPSLALTALYLSSSLATYIKTETDRARIRSAFGHYVAAPLIDELAQNADKLKLGGEMREVTLLFADVRGFSRISEGLGAEELIQFVNKLFTPLSDIILEERGTIDKFMGDAVMAFWNAPVLDSAHAANAARTALRMQAALVDLNKAWAAEAEERGLAHTPVRLGIGLNTGECVVGNVGSPQRFDYSILGDVVNVASRLEEATKTYGVAIIAGEKTALEASGMAFIEIDVVAPRGKDRPERLFALLGDERVARDEHFAAVRAAVRAVRAAIERKDRREAEKHLILLERSRLNTAGLARHYRACLAK